MSSCIRLRAHWTVIPHFVQVRRACTPHRLLTKITQSSRTPVTPLQTLAHHLRVGGLRGPAYRLATILQALQRGAPPGFPTSCWLRLEEGNRHLLGVAQPWVVCCVVKDFVVRETLWRAHCFEGGKTCCAYVFHAKLVRSLTTASF